VPEAIAASIVVASVLALGGWCRFPRFVPQVGNGVLDISVKWGHQERLEVSMARILTDAEL